jgi:Na+/proline symporter
MTIFSTYNVPFWVTVAVTILLIWLYTFKGGIKTIVWTDTLQTLFMLLAVAFSIYFISDAMNLSFLGMVDAIKESEYSRIWFFDNPNERIFFFKQFLSGAFITIVMTGLDQDMMQKNLSCKSLKDAQKNMYWYGAAFVPVNLLFMSLGVLLYLFAAQHGIDIPEKADDLFPIIATQGHLTKMITVFFMLGLIAAAYSSADSALTSLTTSFSIDILDIQNSNYSKSKQEKIRKTVHVGISILLGLVILVFGALNNDSVISSLFKFAGYTYGPLLGLFTFGLFTNYTVKDNWVWFIAILSPIICVFASMYEKELFGGYRIGFELLIYNGILTFIGLFLIRNKK